VAEQPEFNDGGVTTPELFVAPARDRPKSASQRSRNVPPAVSGIMLLVLTTPFDRPTQISFATPVASP
jgi:hypothetical protein